MPAGRPLKYKNIEELQQSIAAYFAKCDKEDLPYTVTGLAVALGTSRETLCEYQERPEYVDTIKGAKDKCEAQIELMALRGKYNPTFSIFSLKNNYGWEDKKTAVLQNPDGTGLFSEEQGKKILKALE